MGHHKLKSASGYVSNVFYWCVGMWEKATVQLVHKM